MNARPDDAGASRVSAFLSRSERRRAVLAAINGAAIGLAVSAAVPIGIAFSGLRTDTSFGELLGAEIGAALALMALGVSVALARHRRALPVARSVEANAPECRNVVITAAELMARPTRTPPYIAGLIYQEAARLVAALDPATLFPARRAVTTLSLTTGLYAVAVFAVRPGGVGPASATAGRKATASAVIQGVDVVVTPPAYLGRPPQSFHDPSRIDALVGSTIHLAVHADAGTITLETVDGKRTRATGGQGQTFEATIGADADGYIALEPAASDGRIGIRRLIGVTVTPDLPPRVKVTAPGHDMLLANGHRTIDVTVESSDDIGLATLRLRYTKVSGLGEQFTFTEGDVPITITRTNGQQWTGKGQLNLDALSLGAGDMVVYRGIATDNRPGSPPIESDSYIVEIAAPGSTPMAGYSADDQMDKYGLSQQMVILKTEQLIANRKTMPPDTVEDQMSKLAAEQRAVRAVFVFMMGGELAEEVISSSGLADVNEVSEAEGEADIAAGRLANQGRIDVGLAVRSMSQANTALNVSDADKALVAEKDALTFLLRAFSHTRIILRALTERERLDLTRRLTGTLSAVGRDVRPVEQPGETPRIALLRRVLADVATAAGSLRSGADPALSGTVSSLAQRVLQVDPGADGLQRIATTLNSAAAAIGNGNTGSAASTGSPDDARSLLDRAAVSLAAEVRSGLLDAPRQSDGAAVGRLDGALTDALRRGAAGGPR